MNYEVGKTYKVRCIELINSNGVVFTTVPIIGEAHRDPQFGANKSHYHIDGRFVSDNCYVPHKNGKTNHVIWAESYPEWFPHYKTGDIVYRRLKCKRETTGILPPEKGKYHDWYSSFVGKSCKGKKCPHLGQEMIEENGVLVCPLHNLKGCADKEIIISYSASQTSLF